MRKIYCKEYTGTIKVTALPENLGYKLSLGLNNSEKPLTIAIEGSEQDLLRTIYDELRFRNLVEVEYFEGYEQR
jgi:hypothetical protein